MKAEENESRNRSVLYQIKNLIGSEAELQQERFRAYLSGDHSKLFHISCRFLQGTRMEGVLIGGNARCFTKLAGTPFFPDVKGRLLLLEAYGGGCGQISTLFTQLEQMGVFNQVAGVLLGTFTYYERTNPGLSVFDLLKMHINDNLPVAYTTEIGQFNYRLLSMCYNIFSASLNHIWKKKVRFTCRSGNSWRNHSDDRL